MDISYVDLLFLLEFISLCFTEVWLICCKWRSSFAVAVYETNRHFLLNWILYFKILDPKLEMGHGGGEITYTNILKLVLIYFFSLWFPGSASVTFTGNSFVKYRLMENENKLEMKLTMRLRTYSAHAVVMYARGTDYSILEVSVCAYLYLRLWETLKV